MKRFALFLACTLLLTTFAAGCGKNDPEPHPQSSASRNAGDESQYLAPPGEEEVAEHPIVEAEESADEPGEDPAAPNDEPIEFESYSEMTLENYPVEWFEREWIPLEEFNRAIASRNSAFHPQERPDVPTWSNDIVIIYIEMTAKNDKGNNCEATITCTVHPGSTWTLLPSSSRWMEIDDRGRLSRTMAEIIWCMMVLCEPYASLDDALMATDDYDFMSLLYVPK